jgi:hypothetical protein
MIRDSVVAVAATGVVGAMGFAGGGVVAFPGGIAVGLVAIGVEGVDLLPVEGTVIDLLIRNSGIIINTTAAAAEPNPIPQGVFKIPRSGFWGVLLLGGWGLIPVGRLIRDRGTD